VFAFVFRQRSLLQMIIAITLGQLAINAVGVWSVSFFIRYHHMTVGQVGLVLGPISCVAGIIGMLLGGFLADGAARKDPGRTMLVIAASLALMSPAMFLAFVMQQKIFAFAAYALYLTISFMWVVGATVVAQNLAGAARRSSVAAIVLTSSSILGSALGPQIAGFVSDLLKPYVGADCLRWSMVGFSIVSLWAALHVLAARRTYLEDLKRALEPSLPATPVIR
jgi:MFS family permease